MAEAAADVGGEIEAEPLQRRLSLMKGGDRDHGIGVAVGRTSYVQDDIADRLLTMVRGMHERVIGTLPAAAGALPAGTPYSAFDADLMLCKALIIAHVRARGQVRWIGRVATIDPNTLVASSPKQTYRRRDEPGRLWIFEPRMGDAEEFELDEAGRVVRRRARDAAETTLVSFVAAAA